MVSSTSGESSLICTTCAQNTTRPPKVEYFSRVPFLLFQTTTRLRFRPSEAVDFRDGGETRSKFVIRIGGEDADSGCSFSGKERSIEKVYSGLCEERDAIHIDDFIPSAFKIFK